MDDLKKLQAIPKDLSKLYEMSSSQIFVESSTHLFDSVFVHEDHVAEAAMTASLIVNHRDSFEHLAAIDCAHAAH